MHFYVFYIIITVIRSFFDCLFNPDIFFRRNYDLFASQRRNVFYCFLDCIKFPLLFWISKKTFLLFLWAFLLVFSSSRASLWIYNDFILVNLCNLLRVYKTDWKSKTSAVKRRVIQSEGSNLFEFFYFHCDLWFCLYNPNDFDELIWVCSKHFISCWPINLFFSYRSEFILSKVRFF